MSEDEFMQQIKLLHDLFRVLEERIIQLEYEATKKRFVMDDDSWYWDH